MELQHDIESCPWCRGDGKDHGTLGMAQVRECARCEGSGRVYVTSRGSATGRRRVYKGPAPAHRFKAAVLASIQEQELTKALQKTRRPHKRKKHARSHAA